MTREEEIINKLLIIKKEIKLKKPLIHCITNPISINDCANMILALGAKPIMAEHPSEVAEITETSKALAINLGNITDVRMKSMKIAGIKARDQGIPSILDVVGVACSKLRIDYAKAFIEECRPSVIKGNMSEIRALCGLKNNAVGIDAGENDDIRRGNEDILLEEISRFSKKTGSVIAVTGAVDIICNGDTVYKVRNGCGMLPLITGTGCMVNVLIAASLGYLAYLQEFNKDDVAMAVIHGIVAMGIAGEKSINVKGPGSFRVELIDNIYLLSDEDIKSNLKLEISKRK